MAGVLTHKYVSAKTQSADATLVSKNEWNDEHQFNPPATGALPYGRLTETDKAAWLGAAAAAGRILVSAADGADIVPAWSAALAVDRLLFGPLTQDADLAWDNTAKALRLFGGALGTDAAKVVSLGKGTAPTTSPADTLQVWHGDLDGSGAGVGTGLAVRDETGGILEAGLLETDAYGILAKAPTGELAALLANPVTGRMALKSGLGAFQVILNGGTWLLVDQNGNVGAGIAPGGFGDNVQGAFAARNGTMPTAGAIDTAHLNAHDEGVEGATGWLLTEESGTVARMGGELLDLRLIGNPAATVANTAAETSVYAVIPTLKANTLGAFRSLRIVMIGDFLQNVTANDKFSIRIKLGAVNILLISPGDYAQNANRYGWHAEAVITAVSANAQVAHAWFLGAGSTDVSGGGIALNTTRSALSFQTGFTQDLATDLAFNVTIVNDTADANESCRLFSLKVYLE